MSSDKKRILIVDDSPVDIQVLLESVKEKYQTLVATSGDKALEILKEDAKSIDLVLLDVSMPGKDGLETCREIKGNEQTKNIDVIFVSANDAIEIVLSGYEAGASDYIVKPVNPLELKKKIRVILDKREKQRLLEKNNVEISDAYMTALNSGGEVGFILNFLRESFAINNVDNLGDLAISVLEKDYGLRATLQMRLPYERKNYGSDGFVSPLEDELLWRLREDGRLLEKGSRLILNFDTVSLLIKNMPIDDEDKRGRYRDHLAILLEGLVSRLQSIQYQHEVTVSAMRGVLIALEENFLTMGLTEQQEELVLNIVEDGALKVLGRDSEFDKELKRGNLS